MSDEFRTEHDTMGEVKVPADAMWGAQTQRAVENFPISGTALPPPIIHALGAIKAAAARANRDLAGLDPAAADAISTSAGEVAEGKHDGQFPIDVYQTGSGTSSNMNANEVIARLASQRLGAQVHPNDQVNASQSSNDVFPSAVHLAAVQAIVSDLVPALTELAGAFSDKGREYRRAVKAGRTHLMDATPVTLGQEFDGYAAQISYGIERLNDVLPRLGELPLGGTAVGTGINTPTGFATHVINQLVDATGLPLREARNHFEAQGARDAAVETSGVLRTIAVSLTKICNDLRWLGSGPRAGLAEIHLPDLQPGSSIMPGKVNPVIPEATLMVAARVIGNDATITVAGASGSFELNVMIPVLGAALLESITLLAAASRLLAQRCVAGIVADAGRMRLYAESTPAIATALNPYLGYEESAAIAKQALAEHKTIREVVVERGHVAAGRINEADLDRALDVLAMTGVR